MLNQGAFLVSSMSDSGVDWVTVGSSIGTSVLDFLMRSLFFNLFFIRTLTEFTRRFLV